MDHCKKEEGLLNIRKNARQSINAGTATRLVFQLMGCHSDKILHREERK
jgi:hypothetical protein